MQRAQSVPPGHIQNKLRQGSGDDRQEMLVRIAIKTGQAVTRMTVIHDDSEAHDKERPFCQFPCMTRVKYTFRE